MRSKIKNSLNKVVGIFAYENLSGGSCGFQATSEIDSIAHDGVFKLFSGTNISRYNKAGIYSGMQR